MLVRIFIVVGGAVGLKLPLLAWFLRIVRLIFLIGVIVKLMNN